LKKEEIIYVPDINLINLEELSVKSMWEELKNDAYVQSFFPNYPPSVRPNSEYFYNVLYKYLYLSSS